jgi:hypothetical protein
MKTLFKENMKGFEDVNLDYTKNDTKRKTKEIVKLQDIICDRVWYERALCHILEEPESLVVRKAPMESIINKYGNEFLPLSEESADFDWGYINGMLSALRWVLGYELGNLDT